MGLEMQTAARMVVLHVEPVARVEATLAESVLLALNHPTNAAHESMDETVAYAVDGVAGKRHKFVIVKVQNCSNLAVAQQHIHLHLRHSQPSSDAI